MKQWKQPTISNLNGNIHSGGIYIQGSEGVTNPAGVFVSNGTTCATIGAVFTGSSYPTTQIFANNGNVDAANDINDQVDLGTFNVVTACS